MRLGARSVTKIAKVLNRFQQDAAHPLNMAILLGPGIEDERATRRRLAHEKADDGLIGHMLGSRGDIATNPAGCCRWRFVHGAAYGDSRGPNKIAASVLHS
jgi:hypothetical protein